MLPTTQPELRVDGHKSSNGSTNGGQTMQVTEVRVYLRNERKLKAFVTVTLDNCLVIHNMKVIQGQKGLILCMPSRKGPDDTFRDVVHPITNEFRADLEKSVFAAYEEEVKKLTQTLSSNSPEPIVAAASSSVVSPELVKEV